MISIEILEDDDAVQSTDWCRPLHLITMSGGHSDYYSFESCYGGQPENNVKWVTVDKIFGDCHFGKKVKEFNNLTMSPKYEFVRGSIPKSHQYGPTKEDIRLSYNIYLSSILSSAGKHKGKTWEHIQKIYPSYFKWAVDYGLVLDLKKYSNLIKSDWGQG